MFSISLHLPDLDSKQVVGLGIPSDFDQNSYSLAQTAPNWIVQCNNDGCRRNIRTSTSGLAKSSAYCCQSAIEETAAENRRTGAEPGNRGKTDTCQVRCFLILYTHLVLKSSQFAKLLHSV